MRTGGVNFCDNIRQRHITLDREFLQRFPECILQRHTCFVASDNDGAFNNFAFHDSRIILWMEALFDDYRGVARRRDVQYQVSFSPRLTAHEVNDSGQPFVLLSL